MFFRAFKLILWLMAVVLALWWSRLAIHSKRPPAEGHWREISADAL